MEEQLIGLGIGIILLIIIYSFFSAFESSITLTDKAAWITKNKNKNSKKFKLGMYFINHYVISLNNILIIQTLSSVGATSISTIFFTDIAELAGINEAGSLGAGISSGLLTFLLLIFGDSIPKTIAKNNPYKVFSYSIFSFVFFYYIFWIFSYLLTKLIKTKKHISSTQEHLINLVKIMNDEGTIDDEAESLIKRSIKFTKINVENIAQTNKEEIKYLNEDDDYYTVYEKFIESGYSRLLVLDSNNQILGIALIKLFLDYLDPKNDEKNAENFKVQDIIDEPLIVYRQDKIDDVLKKMQMERMHFAVVVNNEEDKTFYGIVTLEDIIEEIFGEIYDEGEDDIIPYEQIDDNTWKILKNTNLYTFLNNIFGLRYKINHDWSIYKFIEDQIKLNEWKQKRKKHEWEDKYILITWPKSLKLKDSYFIIKRKDLHEDEINSNESINDIIFSSSHEHVHKTDTPQEIEINVKNDENDFLSRYLGETKYEQ